MRRKRQRALQQRDKRLAELLPYLNGEAYRRRMEAEERKEENNLRILATGGGPMGVPKHRGGTYSHHHSKPEGAK